MPSNVVVQYKICKCKKKQLLIRSKMYTLSIIIFAQTILLSSMKLKILVVNSRKIYLIREKYFSKKIIHIV